MVKPPKDVVVEVKPPKDVVVKPPRFREKKKRRGMRHVFKREEKRKREMGKKMKR
jgi:hypothetical protein